MAFEHKPGSFSLFKNAKGDNQGRPDYRGEGKDLDGQPIEVAAWIKGGGKGKFMSCTFKPKVAQQPKRAEIKRQAGDDMSDIPF